MHTKKVNRSDKVHGIRKIERLFMAKCTNHNALEKSSDVSDLTKVLHRVADCDEATDKVYEREAPQKQKHHQQTNGKKILDLREKLRRLDPMANHETNGQVEHRGLGLQGILDCETEDLESPDSETEDRETDGSKTEHHDETQELETESQKINRDMFESMQDWTGLFQY